MNQTRTHEKIPNHPMLLAKIGKLTVPLNNEKTEFHHPGILYPHQIRLKNLLNRIGRLKMYSKFLWITSCFLLAIFIGVIRYLTGPELALSLFYLFPITAVTWKVGRWAGIFLSLISAGSWLAADLMMLNNFSKVIIPFLNETFRLVVFLIITCILFELKKSLERQKALARTDPLTGILNRRAFFELANLELKKASRFQYPLSVMYIDVDNFKNVNDRFGHNTGDLLLRAVAENIRKNIREIDIIGRFGGDEFCILLSETGAKSAHAVATKLQKKLLDLVDKNHWPVTFSTGVVTYEKIPGSVEEMVKEADTVMYSAKKGKNLIQQKVSCLQNKSHLSTEIKEF